MEVFFLLLGIYCLSQLIAAFFAPVVSINYSILYSSYLNKLRHSSLQLSQFNCAILCRILCVIWLCQLIAMFFCFKGYLSWLSQLTATFSLNTFCDIGLTNRISLNSWILCFIKTIKLVVLINALFFSFDSSLHQSITKFFAPAVSIHISDLCSSCLN